MIQLYIVSTLPCFQKPAPTILFSITQLLPLLFRFNLPAFPSHLVSIHVSCCHITNAMRFLDELVHARWRADQSTSGYSSRCDSHAFSSRSLKQLVTDDQSYKIKVQLSVQLQAQVVNCLSQPKVMASERVEIGQASSMFYLLLTQMDQ